MKPTLAIDFDGVIHEYDRDKWDGIAKCTGSPTQGVQEALTELHKQFRIVIHTCRAVHPDGVRAVRRFMRRHGLPFDDITDRKPAAVHYIDDRALKHVNWTHTLCEIGREGKQ